MQDIIILEHLSKRYRIAHQKDGVAHYRTIREEMAGVIKRGFGFLVPGGNNTKEEIWALKDITLSVKKGEVLGIIGPNGAGKSTLLKILTRITPPSEGRAVVRGSVGSLLEVGTGFHTELTGRENIYLNGSILGMQKREIDKKFDQIVEFSGVEKFLDTPVKRFSSGMCVRLAFSVAAHLEPDILLIDEVLAVGDAAFQKKSFTKMEEVTSRDQRTILFVSHNMQAIRDLCQRCVLLEKGQIVMVGPTDQVVARYLEGRAREVKQRFPIDLTTLSRKGGGGDLRLTSLDVEHGEVVGGKDLTLNLFFDKKGGSSLDDVVLGINFLDSRQESCFMLRNDIYQKRFSIAPGKGCIRITIPRLPLAEGSYSLAIKVFSLHGSLQGTFDWIEQGIDFHVQPGDFYGTGHPGFPESASMMVDSSWELLKS